MIKDYDDLTFAVRLMPNSCSDAADSFAEENLRLWRLSSYFVVSGLTYMLSQAKSVPMRDALTEFTEIVAPSVDAEQTKNLKAIFAERFTSEELSKVSGFMKLPKEANLGSHSSIMAELFICRMVDNYLIYLRDLLALIYQNKPEMLKSSEQTTYEFILQYQTMDELVAGLAEKRVTELAYKGFKELVTFWNKHGLELFPNPSELENVVRIIETRNIIVHNRGILSSTFKKRLPNYAGNVGEHIRYDESFMADAEALTVSAFYIDERAVAKYNLDPIPLRSAT